MRDMDHEAGFCKAIGLSAWEVVFSWRPRNCDASQCIPSAADWIRRLRRADLWLIARPPKRTFRLNNN